MFRIAPAARDHRDAARQRLKGPDGRNARQGPDVGAARDVYRGAESRESERGVEVGEPARVLDAGVGEGGLGMIGVAYPVNEGLEPQFLDRPQEEFVQLGGPFSANVVCWSNLAEYAVERRLLGENPITALPKKALKVAQAVDRRVVVNPEQARTLLNALAAEEPSGDRLVAFFGADVLRRAAARRGLDAAQGQPRAARRRLG